MSKANYRKEYPLHGYTEKGYLELKNSGMMFVWYPEATGSYQRDVVDMRAPKKEENPTPDYYDKRVAGVKVDPYKIAELYGITDHAMFQALKKLLRSGADHKNLEQDLQEAVDALVRKLEMMK